MEFFELKNLQKPKGLIHLLEGEKNVEVVHCSAFLQELEFCKIYIKKHRFWYYHLSYRIKYYVGVCSMQNKRLDAE